MLILKVSFLPAMNYLFLYCGKKIMDAILIISFQKLRIISSSYVTISIFSFHVHVMCYKKNKLLNVKVWFLTKIDLPTRVADSFLVILTIFPTRIMTWPVITCVSLKVIINEGSREIRCTRMPRNFLWNQTCTSCRHVLYILATQ